MIRGAGFLGGACGRALLAAAAISIGLCLTASMAVAAPAAGTQTAAVSINSLRIGFGGVYKVGVWTPVEVSLQCGADAQHGDLKIIVPDGDGVPCEVVEHHVALSPGATTLIHSYAKFGRAHAPVRVELVPAENADKNSASPLAERTFAGDEVPTALQPLQQLIVVVGEPVDLEAAARYTALDSSQPAAIVQLADAAELPERWFGLDGVDFVVLSTGKPARFRQFSPALGDALTRWVQLGGRLIFSVGGEATDILSASSAAARFAPGKLRGAIGLRRFGALENFAGTSDRFDSGWPSGAARPTIEAAQLAEVVGQIEAYEGNRAEELPLVVRRAEGFGEIVFVAIDIASAPFRRWPGKAQFLATLLDRNATVSSEPGHGAPQVQGLRLGFDDLAGQLHTSLDQFAGVRITPFWLVAAIAMAYILLLFPLDYLFSRRGVARPVWPWVRFAMLIAGATIGIWYLSQRGRTTDLQTNQIDIVDFDLQSQLSRGTSWFSLYSPASAEHALAVQPRGGAAAEPGGMQVSWLGLPGDGFGGMNARTSEFELSQFDVPYRCSVGAEGAAGATLGPVPLAAWSSKSFSAHWFATNIRPLESDLHLNSDGRLAGSVHFVAASTGQGSNVAGQGRGAAGQGGAASSVGSKPFELTQCRLFYDRWAFTIPRFSADAPISIDGLDPLTAETLLTRRKLVGGMYQAAPYDRAGMNPQSILDMMMFYRAAGGHQYTGLWNRFQQSLDLSDLLALDRAILVGLGPVAAEIDVDGQSIAPNPAAPRVAFYRFVLPIRSRRAGSEPK